MIEKEICKIKYMHSARFGFFTVVILIFDREGEKDPFVDLTK